MGEATSLSLQKKTGMSIYPSERPRQSYPIRYFTTANNGSRHLFPRLFKGHDMSAAAIIAENDFDLGSTAVHGFVWEASACHRVSERRFESIMS